MAVWKQLLLLCLLGGLGYGGWWVYQEHYAPPEEAAAERPNAPAPVEIVPAERQVLETTVEAVGTTRALQSVEIVPEAAGRIVEITFTPGDRVEKGEVLVRLDDAIQRADLAEAEARSTEQEQVLARARQLRETNAISQATLDRAATEWDDRFPSARRIDFSGRYSDAAHLLDAADTALLLYDPEEKEDAMHASLFRSPNVIRHRYRRGGG